MPASAPLQLLEPSLVHLSDYADALARGWSPNNVRDVSAEQLDAISKVEITTDPDNTASQRAIAANGGRLAGEFVNPRFGDKPKLRYVIDLAG